jgi:hypothetical protein
MKILHCCLCSATNNTDTCRNLIAVIFMNILINNVKNDEMSRARSTKWGRRGMNIGYWWKARRKETSGRLIRRCVDNINIDLREIRWNGADWIDMAQNRDQWRALMNTVLKLRFPWNAGKSLSGCTIDGSSRRAQLREQVSIWINNSVECLRNGKLIAVKRHCFSWIWCYELIFLKTTSPPPHWLWRWFGLEPCEFQAFYR